MPDLIRQGRKVGRTLYRVVPPGEGDGGEDGVLIGVMDTPELAALVVEAVNDLEALRAEIRRVLRFGRGGAANREYIVQFGSGIKPSEAPLIAALLRAPEGT